MWIHCDSLGTGTPISPPTAFTSPLDQFPLPPLTVVSIDQSSCLPTWSQFPPSPHLMLPGPSIFD